MIGRSQLQQKRPRQRDSKCKGPTTAAGTLCMCPEWEEGLSGVPVGEKDRRWSWRGGRSRLLHVYSQRHSIPVMLMSPLYFEKFYYSVWMKSHIQLKIDFLFVYIYSYLKNIETSDDFLRGII